jgi:hypothetical protein
VEKWEDDKEQRRKAERKLKLNKLKEEHNIEYEENEKKQRMRKQSDEMRMAEA